MRACMHVCAYECACIVHVHDNNKCACGCAYNKLARTCAVHRHSRSFRSCHHYTATPAHSVVVTITPPDTLTHSVVDTITQPLPLPPVPNQFSNGKKPLWVPNNLTVFLYTNSRKTHISNPENICTPSCKSLHTIAQTGPVKVAERHILVPLRRKKSHSDEQRGD